jgi:hypothetical protein
MLLSISPLTRIFSPIRPANLAISMLFIVPVFTHIHLRVVSRPSEYSLAMHLIVFPFALVDAAIRPEVPADALDIVVSKLSLILRVVGPSEKPRLSVLLPGYVRTAVLGTVGPSLNAVPVLLVCDPLTLVCCTV